MPDSKDIIVDLYDIVACGDYYYNNAEFDNAMECYNRAIELSPEKSELYRKRALMYMFLHKNDEALIDCSKALEIERSAESYVYCALAYYYMEEYEKTITNYTKAIELSPNDSAYYYARGECYWRLNDCVNAILDYTKAINLNPNCSFYYFHARALVYAKMEQYENAIKDESKAIELCPANEVYYSLRAWYYLNLNKTKEALDDINRCLNDLGGVCADNYVLRAKIYTALNDYDNALLDYTSAIDYAFSIMDTNISVYYQLRGEFYQLIGNNELAEADFKKAEEHSINQ